MTPARADEGDDAPPLRVEVSASQDGPWELTLTNVSKVALRVPADVRLLALEVIPAPRAEDSFPSKKKRRAPIAYVRGKMPICRVPADMRPPTVGFDREVVLQPGERYAESFDPMTICGASAVGATIGPGALVYPRYGYPPRKKGDDGPPFAAAPTRTDSDEDAWKEILGPPLSIPGSTEAPPPHPAGGSDDLDAGPRIEVTMSPRLDVAGADALAVRVTVKNAGERAALLRVRQDDLQFTIDPPHGEPVTCALGSPLRAAVPDFFETWRPGMSRTFTPRLVEVCPRSTFDRPGVYTVRASVVLRQTGEAQDKRALVTTADAIRGTKVRIRTGPLSFYAAPPRVLPANHDSP